MEAHRHSLAEGRVHALEKELEYFKSKHQVDVDKIHEVEEKNRELMAQSTEMQMQIEALKEEMLLMRRPDDALRDEIMHLQGDNRRLIHLLERTSEFRRLMEDVADLKHVHYVPLSDCLVEEELIQHHYQPERDREVVLSREAYNWVPTEAFELVQEFLDRLFPRVPVQPFMMLLLQLNKVWRDHEQGKLDALRAKHQEDIQRYKRKIVNREPYHEVVQKGKIAHLKKELATSNKKGAKMDRYRELAKAAGKDSESKVLLEWGLATIEKLSKQVADCMQENRLLKRRVTAVTSYHGLVPENVIRGLDATSTPAPLNPEDFIKDTPLPASEG